MTISYEQMIDEVIPKQNFKYEDVIVEKNGEKITIEDFVKKTKKMVSWHTHLSDAICDIKSKNGDVLCYVKEFVEEKMNAGFSFKE